MKYLIISASAALLAAPLAAETPSPSLPGVSDQETSILATPVNRIHRGNNDVLFVADRTNRWFRVQLNDGCLSEMRPMDSVSFNTQAPGSKIDRFTRVGIANFGYSCRIESIRKAETPPQENSQTRTTLD